MKIAAVFWVKSMFVKLKEISKHIQAISLAPMWNGISLKAAIPKKRGELAVCLLLN